MRLCYPGFISATLTSSSDISIFSALLLMMKRSLPYRGPMDDTEVGDETTQ